MLKQCTNLRRERKKKHIDHIILASPIVSKRSFGNSTVESTFTAILQFEIFGKPIYQLWSYNYAEM